MPKKKLTEANFSLHTNKLFQTLCYLNPAETKQLFKFLKSPYFNQSKTLIRLYEVLIECIERDNQGFDRGRVWNDLFPGLTYDDINFRKYCSDLLKLVEDFMAIETVYTNPIRRNIDLLEYIVSRKVEPMYNSALRKARSDLSDAQYHSIDFFKNTYEIERLYYAMMDFDVKINTRANIEEIARNLDYFYWIEKLKLHSSALSQKRTGNFEYNLEFDEKILAGFDKNTLEKVPELAIYYYSFLTLFEEDKDEHYFNLRKMLDKYGLLMPQHEAVELYDSALHYCTGKINKGNQAFLQEYFNLFEESLEKGVFIMNTELAPWRFNNAIAAALRLGKLDWAEQFIEKYKNYLPIETRQNTYTFNLARVYRYQRKFDKVLALLHNLEYEDIGYNLISKTMLINAYYELDEQDALESFMESFRVFLNRNKSIPQNRRKTYLNLLKYVRRLTRISPGNKAALTELRQELIREKSNHVNHDWLLEKIDELM